MLGCTLQLISYRRSVFVWAEWGGRSEGSFVVVILSIPLLTGNPSLWDSVAWSASYAITSSRAF